MVIFVLRKDYYQLFPATTTIQSRNTSENKIKNFANIVPALQHCLQRWVAHTHFRKTIPKYQFCSLNIRL